MCQDIHLCPLVTVLECSSASVFPVWLLSSVEGRRWKQDQPISMPLESPTYKCLFTNESV
jgi:hypothetical protein